MFASASTLYEYANTGDDADNRVDDTNWPNYWFGMNFTIGTVGANEEFVVDYISLLLKKAGTPGGINYFMLYNSTGFTPVNPPLTWFNISASDLSTTKAWENMTANSTQTLYPNNEYTIIWNVDALTGITGGNNVVWRRETTDNIYAGGMMTLNLSGGIYPQLKYATRDEMFEVWGTVIPVDTCTCAGAGNNWEIDMSDYCNITDACDLTTGTLSFTGAGRTFCNASIDTTNLGDPGASGVLEIQASCLITID